MEEDETVSGDEQGTEQQAEAEVVDAELQSEVAVDEDDVEAHVWRAQS